MILHHITLLWESFSIKTDISFTCYICEEEGLHITRTVLDDIVTVLQKVITLTIYKIARNKQNSISCKMNLYVCIYI